MQDIPNRVPVLAALLGIMVVLYVVALLKNSRSKRRAEKAEQARSDVQNALIEAQKVLDKERDHYRAETERVREHYQAEAFRIHVDADKQLTDLLRELEPLKKYGTLQDAEAETRKLLADALAEAAALRTEAQALLDAARLDAKEERSDAKLKADALRNEADRIMTRATVDAARVVEDAHRNAQRIAGDAYVALREKDHLEEAVKAVRNVLEGYGDRYVVPTKSLLDDLASDFGHTEAGKMLLDARAQSARMVETGHAAACDYAEANRKETAVRFVIDAFNGRVDALLTRVKHDNFGTLQQAIRDAFNIVNLNGEAFRDARILPAYLESRLTELKWAVVTQELREKEREEQRRIKEQIREEEKARREFEKAMREAEDEEAKIKRALERAREEVQLATAQERSLFEAKIADLNEQLKAAEEKNQRALSMAQQTKKGNVYVISNLGSFGEDVFKIGMTRRLVPEDRIWELSDASVPFDFDIHAMIACDDAPALEYKLHSILDEARINKINYRKEFFRVSLNQIRTAITAQGVEASFTLLADAREYRETQALNKMTPAEREKYHLERDGSPPNGALLTT